MTAKNEARLNMIAAVIALYNLFKARFDVTPRIKTLFTDFIIPKYAVIQSKSNDTRQSTKETTAMKIKEKAELAKAVYDLQKSLKPYAASIGDLVLKAMAGRTLRQLNRLTLDETEVTCEAIITKDTDLLATLEPFGLDQDRITHANNKLANWKTWYTATKLKRAEIAASQADVDNLIDEIEFLLKEEMDMLVEGIKNDTDIQERYDSARVIIAPGTTETQIHFLVRHQNGDGSMHPVYLADLDLHMTYTDKKKVTHHVELSGKTDIDGLAIFKPVRQGFYDYEIKKEGFQVFVRLQHRVKKGKITVAEVDLVPLN